MFIFRTKNLEMINWTNSKDFFIRFEIYIFGRNLVSEGVSLRGTLYEVFSSLNVEEVQNFELLIFFSK
jgi:hypothetical protein